MAIHRPMPIPLRRTTRDSAEMLIEELGKTFMLLRWLESNRFGGRHNTLQAGLFLAALGIVAITPWPVVAQAPVQKNATAKDTSKAQSHGTESSTPDQKPPFDKLIVGAWNVGSEGESKLIVFSQDGSYEDRGVNLFCEEQDVSTAGLSRVNQEFVASQGPWQVFVASQGTWQVQDNRLVLANNDRIALWDKAQADGGTRVNTSCRFDILRLDNGLLRLRLVPDRTTQHGTFFFRRAEQKPIDQEFSAVPPEFRRVLAAAAMTPDEAAAMVDWLKAQKLDSPAQLEVIDRLLQARRHQVTLAQLFGMSNEEATAFREVVMQVGSDYERLVSLATSDLLTPTERKAVDKATSVITDLRRLTEELPMDVQTRVSVYGRAGAVMTRQLAQEAFMAANPELQGVVGPQPAAAGNVAAAARRGRAGAVAEDAPPPGVAPAAARGGPRRHARRTGRRTKRTRSGRVAGGKHRHFGCNAARGGHQTKRLPGKRRRLVLANCFSNRLRVCHFLEYAVSIGAEVRNHATH